MPKQNHLKEIDKGVDTLNVWFMINTIFTIISGVALLVLAILAYFKWKGGKKTKQALEA